MSESKKEVQADLISFIMDNADFIEQFPAQKTDADRVDCAYEILKKKMLVTSLPKDDKSDSISLEHRQNGNTEFSKGSYRKALDYYTQSVATAKTDVVLALAYANRSATLYKLNLYKECIQDVHRAYANHYPDELKEKLRKRRTAAEGILEPMEPFHEDIPIIASCDKNLQIQCASNCVEIQNNEKFGRHVVATRDIQIGEVISVEQPYVRLLTSEKLVHCHHCMELCYNPLPCDICTQALYCSEECRATAVDTYHKYECAIYLAVVELGPVLLALRIAILAKTCDDHALQFDSTNGYYRSDRYKEIHHLELHTNETPLQNLMFKSAMTAVLFHVMEVSTTFFESDNPKSDFKEILMRNLQSLEVSGSRIFEEYSDPENYFAVSMYSFSSLFNHSCCYNTHRAFYGSTLVMRAVNTIKKGQQCCFNYGPNYGNMSRQCRHELNNKAFHFTCQCRACEEDWLPANVNFDISFHDKTVKEKREEARELLPHCIKHLKLCEKQEPFGLALSLKTMICKLIDCLGNQRNF